MAHLVLTRLASRSNECARETDTTMKAELELARGLVQGNEIFEGRGRGATVAVRGTKM